jgi:uncharacterized protein
MRIARTGGFGYTCCMNSEFSILCLSDLHGETAGLSKISLELTQADLVLIAGDITNFGGKAQARSALDAILTYNSHLLAIRGNCDLPAVDLALDEADVGFGSSPKARFAIQVIGLGGGLRSRGLTPFERSEEDLETALDEAYGRIDDSLPFILLAHEPPHGTRTDIVGSGLHVGSLAIRRFIENRKPLIAFCGHIHESSAIDSIGTSRVVNPGPFRDGFYAMAVLSSDTGTWGVESLELKTL